MAIFKKFKQAFGFVDDEDQMFTDDPEAPEAPSLGDAGQQTAMADPTADVDRIFEHVVNVFNATLPDFLKAGANTEAQRKYLYDTLAADIKSHLESLGKQAQIACEQRWLADKENLRQELLKLEAHNKEVEEKRQELNQRQLSADRQKRALSERVHDLEKQVSKLDAEREQYDLENKSLINKLKVAGVYEKENDELRDELNKLQAEVLSLRSGRSALTQENNNTSTGNITETEHEELKSRLEQAEKELAEKISHLAQIQDKLTESDKHIKNLEADNTELKKNLEAKSLEMQQHGKANENAQQEAFEAAVKAEEAEAKVLEITSKANELEAQNKDLATKTLQLEARNKELQTKTNELDTAAKDMNKHLMEATSARETLESKIAELESSLKEASSRQEKTEAERQSLTRQLNQLLTDAASQPSANEIASMKAKVEEAEEVKMQLEAIGEQIERFQAIKDKKDRQIAELKDELSKARAMVSTLQQDLDELKQDRKQNTNSETKQDSSQNQRSRQQRQHKQRRNDTPIDDILSDTDWLVAPSSSNKPSPKGRDRRDQQRTPDNNDSQLSLF